MGQIKIAIVVAAPLAALVIGSTAGTATAERAPVLPASVSPAVVTGHPALGYNTWYQYRTSANEADVLAEGQELVTSGLAAAGYVTVNLDDGWMSPRRNSAGDLVADPAKFPDGMAALASMLHAMGLKLGIYEAIGTRTCQGYPGSYGHYKQDAALFASWQVNYVKIDDCGGYPAGTTEASLASLHAGYGGDLRADSPSLLYSQELPVPFIGTPSFLPAVSSSAKSANSWRVTPDEYGAATHVIDRNLDADIHLHGFARSGHWNDLDMVLPPTIMPSPSSASFLMHEQTQLSGWAMEASPVLISANLANLSAAELTDLKNPDMIAIDQSGAQAPLEVTHAHVQAFVKPADGGTALFLTNTATDTASASYTLSQLGIRSAKVTSRNIWTGRTTTVSRVVVTLAAGASAMLVLS